MRQIQFFLALLSLPLLTSTLPLNCTCPANGVTTRVTVTVTMTVTAAVATVTDAYPTTKHLGIAIVDGTDTGSRGAAAATVGTAADTYSTGYPGIAATDIIETDASTGDAATDTYALGDTATMTDTGYLNVTAINSDVYTGISTITTATGTATDAGSGTYTGTVTVSKAAGAGAATIIGSLADTATGPTSDGGYVRITTAEVETTTATVLSVETTTVYGSPSGGGGGGGVVDQESTTTTVLTTKTSTVTETATGMIF